MRIKSEKYFGKKSKNIIEKGEKIWGIKATKNQEILEI